MANSLLLAPLYKNIIAVMNTQNFNIVFLIVMDF